MGRKPCISALFLRVRRDRGFAEKRSESAELLGGQGIEVGDRTRKTQRADRFRCRAIECKKSNKMAGACQEKSLMTMRLFQSLRKLRAFMWLALRSSSSALLQKHAAERDLAGIDTGRLRSRKS